MARKLTRRQFVVSTAALSSASCVRQRQIAKEEVHVARPNILLIHADQHRFDCLGAYGNPDIRTPHIDALAGEGVRFENSFCPYPVCTPSRYSLLSGRYVHEHRGWSNHCTLLPGVETFPTILKDAGYRTKAVGKMHFTPTYFDVGFEEMILSEQDGPGRWDDDYHRQLREKGLVDGNDLEDQNREYRDHARPEYWDTFGALPSNLPSEYHSTNWIADRAAETVEQWDASGNMLMVGFIKPHHPFDPPSEMCDAYDPEKLPLLPGWTNECLPHDQALSKGYFPNADLTEASLRRVMAYYYATIEHIDQQVGRLVEILKRKGLYENTMIIYTSDHGDYMGFHHLLLKGNYMYDPLIKVPLIIKYPGQDRGGSVSDALVSNVDLAPTILRQAGCRPAPAMGGNDLAGPEGDGARDVVFAESRGGAEAMARTKTRKLLLNPKRKTAFLYDLEKDPLELTNRYDDPAYQDDVRTLTQAIDAWRPFDTLSKVYVDEDAPVIDQPNVPPRDTDRRLDMVKYFAEKMKGDWAE
jgi:arylsulfatase A-like enzyme